ncbi:hypothetical protein [Synechococcus sp. UW179A]|uniref:hypothetical protein n=1 Tax=Synechococcus sp. UW179A TaxID=2575510 RepID=UPI000E0FF971|nr:hypothetical protein [Synechococcus sp. UW179A]
MNQHPRDGTQNPASTVEKLQLHYRRLGCDDLCLYYCVGGVGVGERLSPLLNRTASELKSHSAEQQSPCLGVKDAFLYPVERPNP